MTSFLPTGYELPDNSNYMKFEKGPNKFRVLSDAIVGYVYWNNEGKPVRLREAPKGVPTDIRIKDGKTEQVKHFWAFAVWNYAKTKLQILEITQGSIQGPITDLFASEDWGDPKEYDLTVSKQGEGLKTEYGVQPSPHKAVPAEAHEAYREARINLNAMFEGNDPFATAAGSQGGDEQQAEIPAQDNPFAGAPIV